MCPRRSVLRRNIVPPHGTVKMAHFWAGPRSQDKRTVDGFCRNWRFPWLQGWGNFRETLSSNLARFLRRRHWQRRVPENRQATASPLGCAIRVSSLRQDAVVADHSQIENGKISHSVRVQPWTTSERPLTSSVFCLIKPVGISSCHPTKCTVATLRRYKIPK